MGCYKFSRAFVLLFLLFHLQDRIGVFIVFHGWSTRDGQKGVSRGIILLPNFPRLSAFSFSF